MKKFTKKFFALLLSMFMLASLIPFAALAEGEGEQPTEPPETGETSESTPTESSEPTPTESSDPTPTESPSTPPKQEEPGLVKWIVLDVNPPVEWSPDEEGNYPTPPVPCDQYEPILSEENGTTYLVGWKVNLDTIGAGDYVKFRLESNLGEDFAARREFDENGQLIGGIFPPNYPLNDLHTPPDQVWDLNDLTAFSDYTFTFHDVMAEQLVLQDGTLKVYVGGQEIPDSITWTNENGDEVTTQIYEVVTPGEEHQVLDENGNPIPVLDENGEPMLDENGNPVYETETCTFEVKITGLVALFLAGYFEYNQIGWLPITVEYTAKAKNDLSAGEYQNEAWVTTSTNKETDHSIVTVVTYALQVYKHDSVELDPNEPGYTPLPLAGAEFYLYQESQGHPVTDGNGNVTGWEPNEDEQGNPVTPFKQGVTNAAGQLIDSATGKPIFDGLDAGTYYIVEVQAPDGYVCDHNYKPINIGSNNEAITDYTYTYDVPNVQIPSTGGTGTVVFSVIGACMLVCAGAMYVVYRRRLRTEA